MGVKMKEFKIEDYTINNIYSTFLLEKQDENKYHYIVVLKEDDENLSLYYSGSDQKFESNGEKLLIVQENIVDEYYKCSYFRCYHDAVQPFHGKRLCKKHFDIEKSVNTMKVNSYLYNIESPDDYNKLIEYFEDDLIIMDLNVKITYPFKMCVHVEYNDFDDSRSCVGYPITQEM